MARPKKEVKTETKTARPKKEVKTETETKTGEKNAHTWVANDTANVGAGKGARLGYCFSAPLGTPLPTNANDELDAAFVNLGFCTDDGITYNTEVETDNKVDLSGDVILTTRSSVTKTFECTLAESKADVFKELYGQGNVSISTDGKVTTVHETSEDAPYRIYIQDYIVGTNKILRRIFPKGKVTELGEQTFTSSELIGYPMTVTGTPDDNGVTVIDILQDISA